MLEMRTQICTNAHHENKKKVHFELSPKKNKFNFDFF